MNRKDIYFFWDGKQNGGCKQKKKKIGGGKESPGNLCFGSVFAQFKKKRRNF